MDKLLVGVVMGSKSDREVMAETTKMLDEFAVGYEVVVSSAHRTPERTREYIRSVESRGIKVIIAGAGMAAHLPGVIAAETVLPVIGVPINSSTFNGIDSLLSIVQMPPGIPVATTAVGRAGAKNAALLAIEILALNDDSLTRKLKNYRIKMASDFDPLPT